MVSQSYLHPLVHAFVIKFVQKTKQSSSSQNFVMFRKNKYLKAEITAYFTTNNRIAENSLLDSGSAVRGNIALKWTPAVHYSKVDDR